MGGKWAPAEHFARFESVGDCLPDNYDLRLVMSDAGSGEECDMKSSVSWLVFTAVGVVLGCLMVAIG